MFVSPMNHENNQIPRKPSNDEKNEEKNKEKWRTGKRKKMRHIENKNVFNYFSFLLQPVK